MVSKLARYKAEQLPAIWIPETDEIFFASNAGGALGQSDLHRNNKIHRIVLKDTPAGSTYEEKVAVVSQSCAED